MARASGIVYSVEEMPPPAVAGFSTLQHVAVMSSSLLYPVILATEGGLTGVQLFDFISSRDAAARRWSSMSSR